MSIAKVLVVDDEEPIRAMLRYVLESQDFIVLEAADTIAAKKVIKNNSPDIILLDWMLPQQSGLSFTKLLKKTKSTEQIPIILLTAKADERYKVEGLEAGADDYVVKPFSPPELIARIKAVLRRSRDAESQRMISVGVLKLEYESQRVWLHNTLIKLNRIEFKLLHFFITHPNRVFTRQELLNYVWGKDKYLDERTVDVHVRRLRAKLNDERICMMIQTVYGGGYRFSEMGDNL